MIALALAALLSFQDPPLDAVGDGSLQPPTAPIYRTLAAYDLREVEVLDTPFFTLAITFEALPNPFALPNGFSLPIIELYLYDTSLRPDGAEPSSSSAAELLPGSGMRLPEGALWHYAFRISGDAVQLFENGPDGPRDVSARYNVALSTEGNTITVASGLERPRSFRLYGMVGSYSPFTDSGWQPLSVTPSPWSFASESQRVPVIDVLAATQEAQTAAIQSRTLPAVEVTPPPSPLPPNPWVWLMAAGVGLSLAGFAVRIRAATQDAPDPIPAPTPAPRYRPLEPQAPLNRAPERQATTPPPTAPNLGAPNLGALTPPLPQLPPPRSETGTRPTAEPDAEPNPEAFAASLLLEQPTPLGEGWRWLESDEEEFVWDDAPPNPTPDETLP